MTVLSVFSSLLFQQSWSFSRYPKVPQGRQEAAELKAPPCFQLCPHHPAPGQGWGSWRSFRFGSQCATLQTLQTGQHSPDFSWFFKLTEKSGVPCNLLLFSLGLAWWKGMLYFQWLVLGISRAGMFSWVKYQLHTSPDTDLCWHMQHIWVQLAGLINNSCHHVLFLFREKKHKRFNTCV